MFTLIGKKLEWRHFDNLSVELSNFTETYLAAKAALLSIFDKTSPSQFEGADTLKGEASCDHPLQSLFNYSKVVLVLPERSRKDNYSVKP